MVSPTDEKARCSANRLMRSVWEVMGGGAMSVAHQLNAIVQPAYEARQKKVDQQERRHQNENEFQGLSRLIDGRRDDQEKV